METSGITTLVSDHIIKALCNTLMHSLWQGVLLAAIAGIIIIFTKKASAASRYNLLIGALALFALGVFFTFMWQMRLPESNPIAQISNSAKISNTVNTVSANTPTIAPVIHREVKAGIADTITNYFDTHYIIIVLIWFLIICAKSIQMAVGLHGVFHLRRTKVFAVSKDWENRLIQLTEQLHIKQAIGLLESGIAKVPMVIGHLKPVILIPIGLINSLSPDEVEAILIHELAHIRRRDYLVNLLQSFMEIVFFFNPAVLWLSQLIKTERENCCDDLALSQSRNKEDYIRALVSCEEYEVAGPDYAMAFPGGKNSLLNRVKRIVGSGNHSLNLFEKTVLAICLVVSGLCVSAFKARENIKHSLHHVAVPIKHLVESNKIQRQKPANQINIAHTSTPFTKIQAASAVQSIASSPANKQDTGKNARIRKNFHDIGQELYKMQLLTDTNHMSISLNNGELIVNGIRLPEDIHQMILKKFGDKSGYQYNNSNNGERNGYNANAYSASTYPPVYPRNEAYTPEARRAWAHKDSIANASIAADMIRDDIIKTDNVLMFKLSNKEFIVNGIKQDDDVLQRYRQKYIPASELSGSWTWTHSHNEPEDRTTGPAKK